MISLSFFFLFFFKKDEPKDQNAKMIKILSGEMAIELHLQFLIRNNNTDLMILKNTKVKQIWLKKEIYEMTFLLLFIPFIISFN